MDLIDGEVIRDITTETMDTAGIHDVEATIEVVLDAQGGHRLWISWPGLAGEWFDIFMVRIAPMAYFTPHPTHETYSLLYEAADKLAHEYGDAWYRSEQQRKQSHDRLVAQGALEYE